jgi:tRNA 2-thiouridine synthesizing protein A
MVRNSAKDRWYLWPASPTLLYARLKAPPKMIFGVSAAPLDLRGLNCPLPVLRTRKMLRRLAHGERLIVECTDPLAVIDIPHLLRETGDTLERQEAVNGLFIFHIKRGKG